jgi:hypothetical protein
MNELVHDRPGDGGDADGGAGHGGAGETAVLVSAECLRLIAGCPDALIGGPLVTLGFSTSVRWPWRRTCQQPQTTATR